MFLFYSLSFKVLKLFIIVHIGSRSSFVKFGGQTSKNVHDVRNACLKMTLCDYVCFVEFYEFFLDEIDVTGPKIVYNHLSIGNVWVRLHVRPTRGRRKRTPIWSSTLPGSGNQLPQLIASQACEGP